MGGPELDTDVRVLGLEPLRRENFRVILKDLSRLRPLEGVKILDVGSAYGWFLEEAAAVGAVAVGIEPDARIASHSTEDVRVGFFPDELSVQERFGVIAFNDVLEHLPDVPGALDVCHDHLLPRGLLSINIPTADGAVFKVACGLTRAGIHGPYRRLWQYGLPSPHLHYFTTKALTALIESRGFTVLQVRGLSSLTRRGLWQRIRMVDRPDIVNMLAFAGMYMAADVLNSPAMSDIVHIIAERDDTS
jgi:2-polyprenyl-3-methyl-5-hydroxy-6-metoxy-1,4-benzoquinol methylase